MYGVDSADRSDIRTSLLAAPFVVCLPLALAGLDESSSLAYRRDAITEGQYWRLFTAHLAHTQPGHALLNLAVWPFVLWLAKDRISIHQWGIGFLCCALGVDIGLWQFSPGVQWYVGLSGVLHGLLVLAAIMVWRRERMPAVLVLFGVTAKLVWEQTGGALPGSEVWIGHPVIVDAHLYGVLSGVVCAGFFHIRRERVLRVLRVLRVFR